MRSRSVGMIFSVGLSVAALSVRRTEVVAQPERVSLFGSLQCETTLAQAVQSLGRNYPSTRDRACPAVSIRCVDHHVEEFVVNRRRFCTGGQFADTPAGLADCLREAEPYLSEYAHYSAAQCRPRSPLRDASAPGVAVDASANRGDVSTARDVSEPDIVTPDVAPELAPSRSDEEVARPRTPTRSSWSLALGGAWRGWFPTDGGERSDSWGGDLGVVYEDGRRFGLTTSLHFTRGAEDVPGEARPLTLVEVSVVPAWVLRAGALRLRAGAGVRAGATVLTLGERGEESGFQGGPLLSLVGVWSLSERWHIRVGVEGGWLLWARDWTEQTQGVTNSNPISVRQGSLWLSATLGIEGRF